MIDKSKVSAAFDRAAGAYDAKAEFQHRICERLASRLPPDAAPRHILDGGCGTGYGAELLRRRFPAADIIGCDLAPEMVKLTERRGIAAFCADLEALPFAAGHFDLAWSSLALQWCSPAKAFGELWRVLAKDGLLLAATLGTGTLRELDAAFSGIDDYRHTLPFADEAQTRAALQAAGFDAPRIECETWVTRHADLKTLLSTIRGIGASHTGGNRRPSMMGKAAWQTAQARYEAMRGKDGLLPVTYEVMLIAARK